MSIPRKYERLNSTYAEVSSTGPVEGGIKNAIFKNEEIALKSSCPSLPCGKIELGIDLLLCLVVSSQFNYTKGSGIYAFSIAFVIEF